MTTHTIEVEIEDPDKIITSTYLTGVAKAAAQVVENRLQNDGTPLEVTGVRVTQYTVSEAAEVQGHIGGVLRTTEVDTSEFTHG